MTQKNTLGNFLGAALMVMAFIPAAHAADAGKEPQTQSQAQTLKVVFQVSDADPKKWNLALNNAKNIQDDVGKNNSQVEIVAYGPGISMLQFDTEVGERIKDALDAGITIIACENSMHSQKLSKDDMFPDIAYAKSGVAEIARKELRGYAYIRP